MVRVALGGFRQGDGLNKATETICIQNEDRHNERSDDITSACEFNARRQMQVRESVDQTANNKDAE